MSVACEPVHAPEQDENLRLLHLYHGTDEEEKRRALAALTERNIGLVHSIAARYRDRLPSHPGIEYEDLVQIGTIGMLRAVQSFDFSYRTTFSTYAVPLIIWEIRRCLRDDGCVHVSRDLKRRGSLVLRAKESFIQEHGREPTVGELSLASGERAEMLVFLLDAVTPPASISAPIAGDGEGGDALTHEDILCDAHDAFAVLDEQMTLRTAISKLCERDRAILRLRYEKQLSQQETANLLGLSQVKVSRTEKKIFAFLRGEMGS